jgi:hypothetical protein
MTEVAKAQSTAAKLGIAIKESLDRFFRTAYSGFRFSGSI